MGITQLPLLEPDIFSSLIKRTRIRSRGNCSFVTLRCWNPKYKAKQIEQVKSMKSISSSGIIKCVAKELADHLSGTFGTIRELVVTSVPGGHSCSELSFSAKIAIEVARRLRTNHVKVWEDRPRAGSPFPRPAHERPALKWIAHPRQPVILIDDVVTSGSHMEECLHALRSNGIPTFGIAWIGGEAIDRRTTSTIRQTDVRAEASTNYLGQRSSKLLV
jgi:hypothetical protein